MISIEKLYQDHRDQVYRYSYMILRQRQDAEDITAQTFETAFRKIDQAQGYATQTSWLIQIARNHMSNSFRKKDFVTESEQFPEETSHQIEQLFADPSQDLLQQVQHQEVQDKIHELLTTLPLLQREVIILRWWEDLTLPEIAEATNRSVRAVRASYYRGLERLRELLEEREENERFWAVYILALPYINQYPELIPAGTLDTTIQSIIKEANMHPVASGLAAFMSKPAVIASITALLLGGAVTTATIMANQKKDDPQTTSTPTLSNALSEPLIAISQPISQPVSEPIIVVTEEPKVETQPTTISNKNFTGKYITATLPANWNIQEITTPEDSATLVEGVNYSGLLGIVIKNSTQQEVFRLEAIHGIGGTNFCDEIYQFPDTDQSYIDKIIQENNEFFSDQKYTIIQLPRTYTQFSLLDRKIRRIDNKIYWDLSSESIADNFPNGGKSGFDPECGLSGNIFGSNQIHFSSNDEFDPTHYSYTLKIPTNNPQELTQLDSILSSLKSLM